MTKISKRSDVDPFLVMDVMAKATAREAAGQSIIHMEVGQPGTAAPQKARDRVRAHIDEPLGYTLALGRDDLRKAIAASYQSAIGRDFAFERVILTTGSSTAFQLAFTACFDAGQRVGIAEPGYPSYRNILKALSLAPIGIPTRLADGFQPLPKNIRKDQMDGVLIASPANPTGTILDAPALGALIEKSQSEGVTFISDEIYHGLEYEKGAVSALALTDEAIIINSFSKYYSMTGWRLGWMVVPEAMVRRFEVLAQNLFICPPHISQIAALGALEARDECEANREIYARNRDHLISCLRHIGLDRFSSPDGAFYIYVDVSSVCDNSLALSDEWLDYGIAATSGWDFDPVRGGQFMRLSYARSEADICEGARRLEAWARARKLID